MLVREESESKRWSFSHVRLSVLSGDASFVARELFAENDSRDL